MEGKRFAAGLVAGLLMAVVVVTAAGSLGAAPGPALFGPSAGSASVTTTGSVSTNVVLTMTATTATTASAPSTSATNPYQTGSTNQTSSVTLTTSTAGAISTGPTYTTGIPDQNAVTNAKTPSPSSQLVSIAEQPPLSNALILVPVLVAFLLGAVLYRASIRDRSPSSED